MVNVWYINVPFFKEYPLKISMKLKYVVLNFWQSLHNWIAIDFSEKHYPDSSYVTSFKGLCGDLKLTNLINTKIVNSSKFVLSDYYTTVSYRNCAYLIQVTL